VTGPGVVSTQLVLYDLGFPFKISQSDPESLEERTQSPEGAFIQTNTNEHIPMDLVATNQDEFYTDYREDLWSRPMQMLLKDDDFDQIGELNQVFLWGPVIEMTHSSTTPGRSYDLRSGFAVLPSLGVPLRTRRTFAELMTQVIEYTRPRYVSADGSIDREINMPEWWNMNHQPAGSAVPVPLPADAYPAGVGVFANRLNFSSGRQDLITTRPGPGGAGGGTVNSLVDPGRPWRQVLGAGLQVPTYQPLLPAGAGIFDGVTIDGRGVRAGTADFDGDGTVSDYERIRAEQENANLARGYTGEPTRGLINVNTASPEVLRTLPQMSRMVYNDYFSSNGFSFNQINRSAATTPQGQYNMMHVRLAEAIERYRMGDATARSSNNQANGGLFNDWVPSYADRGYTGFYNGIFDDYASITNPFQANAPLFSNDFYGFYPGMRTDTGIVSLGELLTLDRTQRDEIELYRNYAADPAAPDNAINYLGGETGDYTNSQSNHYAQDFRLKSASIRALGLDPYGCSAEDGSGPWFNGYGASGPFDAREKYGLGYRGYRLSSGGGEEDPFTPADQDAVDARVSTDRNIERRSLAWLKNPTAGLSETVYTPDMVGGDAEEANFLFSGIANMLTTRSDVFTVYFTIRSFKQDPTSGFWDATDKELVIDESRYVMVIDRSTVDGPTDQPRVVAFSKVE
jgi:hypothetical protein